MKHFRSILLITFLVVIATVSTACSQVTEPSSTSGSVSEEELTEKVMTLSIGEKAQNSFTKNALVFNGFPNEKNMSFTIREGHEYTSVFLSVENPKPIAVTPLHLMMTVQSVDYEKATVTIKLEGLPTTEQKTGK